MAYTMAVAYIIILTFGTIQTTNAQQQASTSTQMLITPEYIEIPQGENFTITINATNVDALFSWQVVLKYNGTVVNCTEAWIPSNNVFSGHIVNTAGPEYGKDVYDGLDFMMFTGTLQGEDEASVINGILLEANFTVKEVGSTIIDITTESNPARVGQFYKHYSHLWDPNIEEISFSSNHCTVKVAGSTTNLPPQIVLVVQVPEVDTSRYFALTGYVPVGTPFTYAFRGYPVIFNASGSQDPDGNITSYLWDFGDGNVTETREPVVVHVYNSTGQQRVVLTVFDNGEPPLNSTYRFVVVVGLLLERFDWSPLLYGLAAVLLVAIVVSAGRKARKLRFKNKVRRG
jgi:PKD repeat protein